MTSRMKKLGAGLLVVGLPVLLIPYWSNLVLLIKSRDAASVVVNFNPRLPAPNEFYLLDRELAQRFLSDVRSNSRTYWQQIPMAFPVAVLLFDDSGRCLCCWNLLASSNEQLRLREFTRHGKPIQEDELYEMLGDGRHYPILTSQMTR